MIPLATSHRQQSNHTPTVVSYLNILGFHCDQIKQMRYNTQDSTPKTTPKYNITLYMAAI